MAIIKKNIIGALQGKLTDVIFRNRNGKLVAYTRPSKQKISKSKAAILARNKFAITVNLARVINSDELLSKIWKKSKIKAVNSYQKIIKQNSTLANNNCLSMKNLIVPEGIRINNLQVNYADNQVEIVIDCDQLNSTLLKSNFLYALIHLWKRDTEYSKPIKQTDYFTKLFRFELLEINEDARLTFFIDLENYEVKSFKKGIIYLALAGEVDGKIFWSSTVSKSLF